MNTRRSRIETVLRVRRIQETMAASEYTKAAMAARQAELGLGVSMRRYDASRALDAASGSVEAVLRGRETRVFQAQAIQLGRDQVQHTVETMEARRADLRIRTQAVRAMERLEERLREEDEDERDRIEQREIDDRSKAPSDRDRETFS